MNKNIFVLTNYNLSVKIAVSKSILRRCGMRFMSRLRESFARFMVGRYGPDQFYNFLLGVYLVLLVLNLFFNSLALMLLETALFVYMFFRVFSRNIYKRQEENRWYLKVSKKPKDFFALMKWERDPSGGAPPFFLVGKGNENAHNHQATPY